MKTNPQRPQGGMSRRGWATAIGLVVGWMSVGPVLGQSFDTGSTGALGDVVVAVNTTMNLPDDGVLHFKSLKVNTGVRLNFRRNPRNTTVAILSKEDVIIDGTIDVNGGAATVNSGGLGGPGGFDGGKPGFGTEAPSGAGYGPGGGASGINQCGGAAAADAGSFGTLGVGAPTGKTYGNTLLIPMLGGSGGGGANMGSSGGGGGGAGGILIASNTRIALNGQVEAIGGFGGACDNAGSGGAIRLVAFKVEGSGRLEVVGGPTAGRGHGAGGAGRTRVDTVDRSNLRLAISHAGTFSTGGNLIAIPPLMPRLDTVEVAGNSVPLGSGPVTFTLPFGSTTARTVKIRAQDFGRSVPIRVTLTPDSGEPVVVDGEIDNVAANPAILEVPVTVPVNTLVTVHAWTR